LHGFPINLEPVIPVFLAIEVLLFHLDSLDSLDSRHFLNNLRLKHAEEMRIRH
jgi:hypothetical protein